MKNKSKTVFLVQFSVLLAIEIIFCFTPLGSLPALGPMVMTLGMIPVIVTAILLGTKAGTVMGALTGLFSFIVWTFMPPSPIVAFVYTPFYTLGEFTGNFGSLLICFVPRTLVGTVTGLVYTALAKSTRSEHILCFSVSAALGSLTNTFGVLGGAWLFFGSQYSSLMGQGMLVIVGTMILTNGIPEAVLSAIAAPAVCKPLKSAFK